jgi:hypothetical protein
MHTKTKKDSKKTLFQSQKEKNYNEITRAKKQTIGTHRQVMRAGKE